MYSRDQIDQVRTRVDIVEVVREYVPSLKVAGRSVRGLCPFHSERTPSFHVHPEKGLYKCFGCGESGDVIAFVSKMEQTGFSESLEFLAGKAGITLQKSAGAAAQREPEGQKEKLFRILEAAARIYEEQLRSDRTGEAAQKYLEERGVTDESARHFMLGVAAPTGGAVFEQLVKKGFSIELCQLAGLAGRSASGRFYDPMFGRLIFPILDSFGHVVGFGGRVLPQTKKFLLAPDPESDGEAPKYLNSPETPVFSKGKLLYGLYQGKSHIMSARKAVVLEGYMDVVSVHQGGFPFAVATLGTAFTRDHAKLLKRYAQEIIAFFDPDEAGRKAALRSFEPMVQEDFFTRAVWTDETVEPDEIILNKGAAAFEALLENAPDFVDYMLKLSPKGREMSLMDKAQTAKQILAVIAQSPNEILKSEWTRKVAAGLGLQEESLRRELSRKPVHKTAAAPTDAPSYAKVPEGEGRFLPGAEEELLQVLIAHPGAWNGLEIVAEDFSLERERWVFRRVKEQVEKTGRVSVPALHDEVEPADKEWLLTLSLEDKSFPDPMERRNQLSRDVQANRGRRRLTALSSRMRSGNVTAQEREEYNDLLRRVKGSGRVQPHEVNQS